MGSFQFFHSVPPKINTHSITTFLTPKVKVPIFVSPYINVSAWFVSFWNDTVAQPGTTYCELFWTYRYLQQPEMFHPSAVGICRLIPCRYGYFLNGISTKRSGQWWYWSIFNGSFETRVKCSLIYCNFFLVAQKKFNFIDRVWFNCFAPNYILIFLIFVKRNIRIFLVIFLSTIFSSVVLYYHNLR